MTSLAPTLQTFFTERLVAQRRVSPHTVASYRDTWRLLLGFAEQRVGKEPSALDLEDLDAPLIGAFLEHLETVRHNRPSTRNARLVAVHSFFRFAAFNHPEQAALIQRVLAIPQKRVDRQIVSFLTKTEMEALLSEPDRTSWIGRRDHALLVLAMQTGLRVSELTNATCGDIVLGAGPHVRCTGKGRKDRQTPLTRPTIAILREWMYERRGDEADALFPSRRGGRLSCDAVELLVAKYARGAKSSCPSLRTKTVTPHVLRHSCAMALLEAGIDVSVIALWLGHESIEATKPYLHADLGIKERALARTAPPGTKPGRYRPPDSLLAFLEGL
ncbi:MAG TPA: tyrosine-type recombinase/integrase [Acidimicrobiales bacterium]|jgi:integrase/recombinase XerD|nr:tyrosine-type recombinase/integrase [Acidimicrobiales bacterium]